MLSQEQALPFRESQILRVDHRLSSVEWQNLCDDMIFNGFKWDMQIGDQKGVADFGITLPATEAQKIFAFAENLWKELIQMEAWLQSNPSQISLLGLPSTLVKNINWAPGNIPRIARFDFHLTSTGWKISEVNSDVPGGLIESSLLPEFWPRKKSHHASTGNVSRAYVELLARVLGDGPVGLLHAPWYSDDRQQMEFLKSYFKDLGIEAHCVGPEQVEFKDNHASIFGRRVKYFVRFYPAEWMIHTKNGKAWLSSSAVISNPLHSIFSQAKRLPLIWEKTELELPTWRKLLPRTRKLDPQDFVKHSWVIKPNLGRIGEGIYLPGVTNKKEKRKILLAAARRPRAWVAQEAFEIKSIGSENFPIYPCLGVYVIDGKATGIYGRVSSSGLTDERAADCPVFIERGNT